MARAGTINLIPTNIENTPEMAGLYTTLRKLGLGGVVTLITLGLIVGGLVLYLSARQQGLTTEKQRLTAAINQESIKEGLLLTAKQRIVVIDKILADQKDPAAIFKVIQEIAPSGQLNSVALSEANAVTLVVHVETIPDAVVLVDSLMTHAQSGAVSKPVLTSFTIPKEGGFELTVSFVPKI